VTAAVVDTNVLIVANLDADHASIACIESSIETLSRLRRGHIVALDDGGRILAEYRRYGSLAGQPGIGDAFLRYLYDNLGNKDACELVAITPTDDGSFEEFPSDERLSTFDAGDRKFVAVALGCDPHAKVLNATDRDWWEHREHLLDNGIAVCFLCPDHMDRRSDR